MIDSYQLDAIRQLSRQQRILGDELETLLLDNFCHPDSIKKNEYLQRVVRNLAKITLSHLNTLTKRKRISFLKALGGTIEVAQQLELWVFYLGREDADWFWHDNATFFSHLTSLTYPLEGIRSELKKIDRRSAMGSVILVEGKSEYGFLNDLREDIGLLDPYDTIYNYEGKGNVQNLVHYIREKYRQGLRVLLTCDSDGSPATFERKLRPVMHCISARFQFRKDFEHSFPDKFFEGALMNYRTKYIRCHPEISVQLMRDCLSNPSNFSFGVNKPKLALILSGQMRELLFEYRRRVFTRNRDRFKSEIFDFLRFLSRNR
jgi:hypothetical protein